MSAIQDTVRNLRLPPIPLKLFVPHTDMDAAVQMWVMCEDVNHMKSDVAVPPRGTAWMDGRGFIFVVYEAKVVAPHREDHPGSYFGLQGLSLKMRQGTVCGHLS